MYTITEIQIILNQCNTYSEVIRAYTLLKSHSLKNWCEIVFEIKTKIYLLKTLN